MYKPDGGRSAILHASARYAADELDGSRARQTSGIEACEPVARYGGARTVGRSSGQAATLKHPLSRKALLWGRGSEREGLRFVERHSWAWLERGGRDDFLGNDSGRPFCGIIEYNDTGEGERMDKEIIFLVEEAPEGGYIARALGYSIFTESDTLDAIRESAKDAVRCHFDEGQIPRIIRLHYIREEIVAI